jgi:archaellum biogenesis ATPase FlaH
MQPTKKEYRAPRTGEIAAFLSRHTHKMKTYDDELRFRPCPKCSGDNAQNPSVNVNVKTGLWRCFRCGSAGNWFQLTKAFGEPLHVSDRYKIWDPVFYDQKIIDKFINEIRRPVFDGHYPELLDYCHARGLNDETLKTWRVSSKGEKALRWPIFDLIDGKWVIVNMKVRSIDEKSATKDWFDIRGDATDLLIGNHLLDLDGPKRAIITEGQWDAMTGWQLGLRNIFSLPNGASNINVAGMLRFIPDDWEIVLCVDMDIYGDGAAERFFAQLGTDRVSRLKLPKKDLNEWLQSDPFITDNDVLATHTESESFFLDQKGFIKIDMSDEILITDRIVCRTPWDEFNELIAGGLYEGQTTGLLGPSGQGKTTWVNQLAIGVTASQISVGLISVEGSRDALMVKLRDTIMGSYDKLQFKTIENHLLISPLAGHKITEIELMRETQRLIDAGARLIVIDNLDHMYRGDSQKKSDVYGMLIEQAVNSKTHFIVVWQPHKVDRGQIVNSGSQKGFSMSLQDADNYFNLNRLGDGIYIEIEKTRQRGIDDNDSKVWFTWDKQKRIYSVQKRFTNQNITGKLVMLS